MMNMPGSIYSLHSDDNGECCETEGHEAVAAVKKIQGETDSFGCEYIYVCQECLDEYNSNEPDIGNCEWCNTPDVELLFIRDIDEGSHGPLYEVCRACYRKEQKALEKEYYDFLDDD